MRRWITTLGLLCSVILTGRGQSPNDLPLRGTGNSKKSLIKVSEKRISGI